MSSPESPPRGTFRHAYPLFALLGLGLLAALVVRGLLVPETFGKYGHYRAAALDAARAPEPRHQGESVCATCHEEQATVHAKDAHTRVQCETCHGVGAAHAKEPDEARMVVPRGKDPCLVCHRMLLARPGPFPQVVWEEHYRFVGVADPSIDCVRCHDPHEPLFMDRDRRTARLHPLIQRCRDCHLGRFDDKLTRPEGHPVIFECAYCHPTLVADFASRAHHDVRCTTCHIFSKETDFSGRIIRDADPRFCLLCHRQAPFRAASAPPGIAWPEHLADVGADPARTKPGCLECHRDQIHGKQGG